MRRDSAHRYKGEGQGTRQVIQSGSGGYECEEIVPKAIIL